ncbi:polyprenyl synthetase family protein [Arcanobacterium hippocoleae]
MSFIDTIFPEHPELAAQITAQMEAVEAQLAQVVSGSDAFTDNVTAHLALAGGKRLRPLLCFMAAQLGPNPNDSRVLDAALSVELTHLASLYHDDVMDEAPLRRVCRQHSGCMGIRPQLWLEMCFFPCICNDTSRWS